NDGVKAVRGRARGPWGPAYRPPAGGLPLTACRLAGLTLRNPNGKWTKAAPLSPAVARCGEGAAPPAGGAPRATTPQKTCGRGACAGCALASGACYIVFVQVVLRKIGRGSRAVIGRLVRAPRKGSVVVIEFSDGMHEYVTTPVKRVLRLAG